MGFHPCRNTGSAATVLRKRCEGWHPAECVTTQPHCPSPTPSNLPVYQLQVDHRGLQAITPEPGYGCWRRIFWIPACAGMTREGVDCATTAAGIPACADVRRNAVDCVKAAASRPAFAGMTSEGADRAPVHTVNTGLRRYDEMSSPRRRPGSSSAGPMPHRRRNATRGFRSEKQTAQIQPSAVNRFSHGRVESRDNRRRTSSPGARLLHYLISRNIKKLFCP